MRSFYLRVSGAVAPSVEMDLRHPALPHQASYLKDVRRTRHDVAKESSQSIFGYIRQKAATLRHFTFAFRRKWARLALLISRKTQDRIIFVHQIALAALARQSRYGARDRCRINRAIAA